MSPALPLLLQHPEYSPERKERREEVEEVHEAERKQKRRMVEKQEGGNEYIQSKVKG